MIFAEKISSTIPTSLKCDLDRVICFFNEGATMFTAEVMVVQVRHLQNDYYGGELLDK